jgi:16S rRNA (guanine966-N2)-methyltransferase
MLELNKIAYNDIIKNKKLLNCDNIEVINSDAISYLKQSNRVFDIIFMDPPYDSELLNNSLEIILHNKNLYQNTLIYIETNKNLVLKDFNIIKDKKTSNIYYKLIKLK